MVSCCTNWTYRTQGDFLHKLNCLNPRCILALHPRCLLAQIKLLEPKVSSCKNFNYMYERCLLLQVQQDESLASACTIVEQHAHCTHGVFLHNLNYLNPRCLNPWCLLHKKTWYPLALWIKWTHGFFLHKLNNMSPWYPVVHIEQNEPMSVFLHKFSFNIKFLLCLPLKIRLAVVVTKIHHHIDRSWYSTTLLS